MLNSRRRLLALIVSILLLLVGSALLYMVLMSSLEHQERGFWRALGWAAETITSTGYGADAEWSHPILILFIIALQFFGVFIVYLVVPIFLIPYLEERFETRLPRKLAKPLEDHVVIFRYGPAVENLIPRLEGSGVPVVVLEENETVARSLLDEKIRLVFDPRGEHSLMGVNLETARALIANGEDVENAGVILSARQKGFKGEVLALVEEPFHRPPMVTAGASVALTPRHVLAAALSARASDLISPRLAGIQQIGELQVREIRIHTESTLSGKSLSEAAIGAHTGAVAIGQWVGGLLVTPLKADTILEPRSILIVAGTEEALDLVEKLCGRTTALITKGFSIIAGFGEVGRKVFQMLTDAGEEVRVIDREAKDLVDVVGDFLDPRVGEKVELNRARSVILALDNDDTTLFGTMIARNSAPESRVIARVNRSRLIERIHQAGADFALSLAQVSGQLLARRLLGEEGISLDPQLRILKVAAQRFVGKHPTRVGIRERTGCSVLALARSKEIHFTFPEDFRVLDGDQLYLVGDQGGLIAYRESYT